VRAKITKSLVESLKPGETVTDTQLDGFRIRAGKVAKIYCVQKRIGQQVVTRTIGRHGVFLPEDARKEARKVLLQLNQGIDPLDAKRKNIEQQSLTFRRLVDLYLEERELAESTRRDIRTKVQKHLADWMNMSAADITRSVVLEKHRKLTKLGPTQAGLIARYARAIFNFSIRYFTDDRTGESLLPQNPVLALTALKKMPKPRRRETFLDKSALQAWFKAWSSVRAAKPTACDYIIATLLLGCRRNEAAKLRWSDVNLGESYVRFRNTKNKTDHVMPTGPFLTNILKKRSRERPAGTEFVFPGRGGHSHIVEPRKTMAKISDIAGTCFMMSDLRRTFATHCAALGISYFDIKRLLNHKMDNREATPGYIIVELDRKREQVALLEQFVLRLSAPAILSAQADSEWVDRLST
jgi:integrase